MKFLIDENLPPRLAAWLRERGHDALHCADCLGAGRSDETLASFAAREDRVIVTKDADFETPRAGERVLHLRIGNCSTADLLAWLEARIEGAIERLAGGKPYVEL